MDNTYPSEAPFHGEVISPSRQLTQSRFMSRTYGWMFLGLLVTAGVSMSVASSENAIRFIFGSRWVFYGILIAELAVVIGISAAMNRLSSAVATVGFLFYSALNGITFSVIFLTYELGSIGQIFFLAAGMFGALALWGSATKKNLSGLGTFMMMGLFGVVILGLINLFTKSEYLNFSLGVAGILIFSGLTAYDVQKIRSMSSELEAGEEEKKGAIFGALTLYLDFINLFLSLLRVFGRRRE